LGQDYRHKTILLREIRTEAHGWQISSWPVKCGGYRAGQMSRTAAATPAKVQLQAILLPCLLAAVSLPSVYDSASGN